MKLFHTDQFVLPLPDGHRFPMARYRLLHERLVECGLFSPEDFCIPPAATDDQLHRVHTRDWIDRVSQGQMTSDELRRVGFPWSPEMVERCRRSTGATIAASVEALQDGVAANLAGGTHHAFSDRGAGYCVFNDVAVAIRQMQAEGRIQRAVVFDGDVHQGDGTASIFQDDADVRTFSLHAKKAFPVRKMQSDVDIELPPGSNDEDYLEAWNRGLTAVVRDFEPDLAFFLAGADPFHGDTLGGLSVSRQGLSERDAMVFDLCLSQHWPLVIAMAGGYALNINDIVDIQFDTVVAARRLQR